jgi:hypothetical protein
VAEVAVDRGQRTWRAGRADQAALAVEGGFFLGFLAGFLVAG